MDVEVIRDDSGWCFKMPRLTWDMIEKYGLGTWDLADWTWGTPYAIVWFYKGIGEFDWFDRVVWRVENKLRFWEWWLFFNNHRVLCRIVGWIRRMVFWIGWKKAVNERG